MINCKFKLERILRERLWPNFKVISRRSPGRTEEKHEKPQSV
jgi:hypothetical protein